MRHHLTVLGAILRKDCRLFWLQGLATAALLIYFQVGRGELLSFRVLAPLVALTSVLLVFRVVQADAPASTQQHWLTHPIPWMDAFGAKLILLLSWFLLCAVIGTTIQQLNGHYPLAEALMVSLSVDLESWVICLTTLAIAILTTNLWQAAIAGVATTLAIDVLLTRALYASGDRLGTDLASSGTGWLLTRGCLLLVIGTFALIVWLQYARRRTALSRAAYLVALLLMLGLPTVITWPQVFAVQKLLVSDATMAAATRVELAPGCFDSKVAYAPLDSSREALRDPARIAGTRILAFTTVLTERSGPSMSRLMVDRLAATYLDANGRTLLELRPSGATKFEVEPAGSSTVSHSWVMTRAQYRRLAATPGVHLQLDYSLSVLMPELSVELGADGQRRHYAGLGYCGFKRVSPGEAVADCFTPGSQHALLVANLADASSSAGVASGSPNYVPASLDFLGGQRHSFNLSVPSDLTPRIRITAYEDRAHFDRRLTASGVLGGNLATCPAPG